MGVGAEIDWRARARELEADLDDEPNAVVKADLLAEAAGYWFEAGDYVKAAHRFGVAETLHGQGENRAFHIAAIWAAGRRAEATERLERRADEFTALDWEALGTAFVMIGDRSRALGYFTRALHLLLGESRLPTRPEVKRVPRLASVLVEIDEVMVEAGIDNSIVAELLNRSAASDLVGDQAELERLRAENAALEAEIAELTSLTASAKTHNEIDFDDPYWDDAFEDAFGGDEILEPYRAPKLPGRNEPCHCGSGKKFKKCCLKRSGE